MAGGVHIEVDLKEVSGALLNLAKSIEDRRVPNRQLAVQMSSWIARNFREEGRLNVPWERLADSTANRKSGGRRRGYAHILVGIGQGGGTLRASFTHFSYDNNSAGVGSDVPYAEFHEDGGPNLPRRPMLPTEDIALSYAFDVYKNYIDRAAAKAGLA
jgi:phage gpG-like protein